MADEPYTLNYRPGGPVLARFLQSRAFIRGIRGPLGSGKSAASAMRLFSIAAGQPVGKDGKRRSRLGILRQTYGELKTTTIKTWCDWFPESVFGPIVYDAPIRQVFRINDVESEVLFVAAERPDHVKKLLSMELTAAWVNEAREMPKEIVDALTARVGRYPRADDRPDGVDPADWPFDASILMDTNSMDDDHWWYRWAEHVDPEIEEISEKIEIKLRERGILRPWQELVEFFSQPDALGSAAENVEFLRPGYYDLAQVGKTIDWINLYLRNKYGRTRDGKPVYPEWAEDVHVAKEPLVPTKGLPLWMGFDFGLTPACVIAQLSPRGQFRVLREMAGEDMGLEQFLDRAVKPLLANEYPGFAVRVSGDPAGTQRAQSDERTCYEVLKRSGFKAEPARTNNFTARREAVAHFLSRLVDGRPGFVLDPSCRMLRSGFNGGYAYRRLRIAGDEPRYVDEPEKSKFSHPHDALQYVAMQFHEPKKEDRRTHRPVIAIADQTGGY